MSAHESGSVQSPLRVMVAEEVRALMARRRVNGVQVARRIGRSHTYVWRRLAGETPFDLDDLERIAAFLEVEVSALLPPEGSLPSSRAVPTGRDGEAITYRYRTVAERMTVDQPIGGLIVGGVRRPRRIGDPAPIPEPALAAAA